MRTKNEQNLSEQEFQEENDILGTHAHLKWMKAIKGLVINVYSRNNYLNQSMPTVL